VGISQNCRVPRCHTVEASVSNQRATAIGPLPQTPTQSQKRQVLSETFWLVVPTDRSCSKSMELGHSEKYACHWGPSSHFTGELKPPVIFHRLITSYLYYVLVGG